MCQVLARAITKGCNNPVNDYLKMTNKKKVVIRDINPKSISTQELYGFVNMSTREWKVRQHLRPCVAARRIRTGVLMLWCRAHMQCPQSVVGQMA